MLKDRLISYESIDDISEHILKECILSNDDLLVLSGGSSMNTFYKNVAHEITKPSLVLSDERLTNKREDSNRQTLSKCIKNFNCSLFGVLSAQELKISSENIDDLFRELLLKTKRRIGFISIGEDGHICSLFNDSEVIEHHEYVVINKNTTLKSSRISLTFAALNSLDEIHFFLIGKNKREILENDALFSKSVIFDFLSNNNIDYTVHVCLV
jgi:6-phosphogluconolactonase/glucosamine-6-phosphate isomerase/deaminase